MDPLGTINSGQGYGRTQQPSLSATDANSQAPRTPVTAGTATPDERHGIRLPEDRVSLSGQRPGATPNGQQAPEKDPGATERKPDASATSDGKSQEDPQIKQAVERLKQNEEKVKAHEAAHKAAGGNLAGSASYSYTQGPDGRSYITGGEVQIDISTGRTPQETISRMQQVIRAALAPADPSGQDRAVAAQAASQMAQAQQEKLQTEETADKTAPGTQLDPTQTSDQTQPPDQPPIRRGSGSTSNDQAQRAYGDVAVGPSFTGSTTGGPSSSDEQRSESLVPDQATIPRLSSYA